MKGFAFACVVCLAAVIPTANAQDANFGFFITSKGSGDGANLGGIAGADAQCQGLAEAVGAGAKTWHAYLSSRSANAADRIGNGPWYNVAGVMIAKDLAALHSDANLISKQTGLTEKGAMVNSRGDSPLMHDILTGSSPAGTFVADMTCSDWTSNGEGSAMVGHHDRMGLRDDVPSKSWNSSHGSRGCSQDNLRGTGGNGLFYCFATN